MFVWLFVLRKRRSTPSANHFFRRRDTWAPTVSADSDCNRSASAALERLHDAQLVRQATVDSTALYLKLPKLAEDVSKCISPEQWKESDGVSMSSTHQSTSYWCVQYLLAAARQLHAGPRAVGLG